MTLAERIRWNYRAIATLLRVERVARSYGFDTKVLSDRFHRHMKMYWILQNRHCRRTGKYILNPTRECCSPFNGECKHFGSVNLYIAKLELGMK